MVRYCSRCKTLHNDNEMCPNDKKKLKEHPELLREAADFTLVAGQYHLITSQTLDKTAQGINKIIGTDLSFEGTHQLARDIQVFRQLNVDPYCKSGIFSNAKSAQDYFSNATQGQLDALRKKLNGTGQEIDWLRWKQGKLSSLFAKSKLLGEETTNAAGIDGVTVNRFTGKVIEKTTVKAAESSNGLGTDIRKVLKALKSGTLDPKDTLLGVDGTKDALEKALERNIKKALANGDMDYANKLKQAQEYLKVNELNNYDSVKASTARLTKKISTGQAYSAVTMQEVSRKACQGAVIGAAVGLTISGITNYMKYKNGEITEGEAFKEVGEETLKGAVTGAAMGAITIFLPAGPIGFAAGMAIGIYINASVTNVLDEVFGKGAYGAILDASGYTCGMAVNLEECIEKIEKDHLDIERNKRNIINTADKIHSNFDEFEQLMKG